MIPSTYTLGPGESPWAVAKRFFNDESKAVGIQRLNGLRSDELRIWSKAGSCGCGRGAGMIEVIIDNRNKTMWDISELITDMTWATSRSGKPAKMSLTYVSGALFQSRKFTVNNGDVVRVKVDGKPVFYGYVFTIETSEDDKVKLTAYDQIRYLLTNDTYVLENVTATDLIKRIAKDCELKIGELSDTKHVIPLVMEDNKKLLDIICRALDKTLIATRNIFIFYDDFGKLTLRDAKTWTTDIIIGEESQMRGSRTSGRLTMRPTTA